MSRIIKQEKCKIRNPKSKLIKKKQKRETFFPEKSNQQQEAQAGNSEILRMKEAV